MHDQSMSTKSIKVLHDTVAGRNAERAWTMKALAGFKEKHLVVRDERDKAVAEVARLRAALAASEKEKARLSKREQELAREVSMMAAAIDVAVREIAESDSMVMDAAAAVEAEIGPGQRVAASPQVKVAAQPQAPQQPRPQAQGQQQAKPASAPQQARPQAAAQQPKPQATTQEPEAQNGVGAAAMSSMPPADMPEELAESFLDIERILEQSLNSTDLTK